MEAIRYLSDIKPGNRYSSGLPSISIATRAVSLLIQQIEEEDQRIMLACLIFTFGVEGLDQDELRQLFGAKVMEYLTIAGAPEELAIRKLQRLTPAETRERVEAGRKIVLAKEAAVCLYQTEAGKKYLMPATVKNLSHLYPAIHTYFDDLT